MKTADVSFLIIPSAPWRSYSYFSNEDNEDSEGEISNPTWSFNKEAAESEFTHRGAHFVFVMHEYPSSSTVTVIQEDVMHEAQTISGFG